MSPESPRLHICKHIFQKADDGSYKDQGHVVFVHVHVYILHGRFLEQFRFFTMFDCGTC